MSSHSYSKNTKEKYKINDKVFYKPTEIEATIIDVMGTIDGYVEYRIQIKTKSSTSTLWAKESQLTYVGEGD